MKLDMGAVVEAMRQDVSFGLSATDCDDMDEDSLFEIVLETGIVRSDGSPVQIGVSPAPGGRIVLHDRGATLARRDGLALLGPANLLLGTLVRRQRLQVVGDKICLDCPSRVESVAASAMRLAQASAAVDCALDAFGVQP